MRRVALHRDDTSATARHKFETDTACTCKEVEHIATLFEIGKVGKHIEEIFLGKIRRRTRLKGTGHLKGATFVFSTDYSHAMRA